MKHEVVSPVGGGVGAEEAPACETYCVHTDVTRRALRKLPEENLLFDLAELYKMFGDSTRVKILFLLFEEERCVCDIAQSLHMTTSAISHQLRILKNAKLITYRREGKSVIYALADDHVSRILELGLEHVCE